MNECNRRSKVLNCIRRFISRAVLLSILILPGLTKAQFEEEFQEGSSSFRSNGIPGWSAYTGDGEVKFTQAINDGVATLRIDSRADKRNIWYAFIHRDISGPLFKSQTAEIANRLVISARVKTSHAPRRVNLYLKSTASGDEFLREFDLPEANKWYEIAMTSDTIKHLQGKFLLGQISMMDWGNTGIYELQVDYIKVDLAEGENVQRDKGNPQQYRPPLADPATFAHTVAVTTNATVDRLYPTLNLAELTANSDSSNQVLMIDGTKTVLLYWNLDSFRNKKIVGSGQLEFYTHSVFRLQQQRKDFGEIRVCEILGGATELDENKITYDGFLNGNKFEEVINEQTIIDAQLTPGISQKTTVTISEAVMQRLIDRKTKGLALKPLGLISAVLMDQSNQDAKYAARLRFNSR